jgi:hypothetical protein
MGIGVYVTRFGAVGGNVPGGTKCVPGEKVINSEVYYSLFKQIS